MNSKIKNTIKKLVKKTHLRRLKGFFLNPSVSSYNNAIINRVRYFLQNNAIILRLLFEFSAPAVVIEISGISDFIHFLQKRESQV
jgi:hypothetical protein